jgi:RNA polymerase sigma factor (sigma-70 family)
LFTVAFFYCHLYSRPPGFSKAEIYAYRAGIYAFLFENLSLVWVTKPTSTLTNSRTSMEVTRNFPDDVIVSNIRSGRQMDEVIKALYRSNFSSLSWYVMNNNGSMQDAEDIFQEVLMAFIEAVQKDKFRGDSTVSTFLFSLNRFTWLNELKKRGRAALREEKYEKEQDKMQADTNHLIEEREGKAEVIRLVGELGESCRKILLLFYYENLSMREILVSTEYENEQVLRNKKYKCLKQLEQMVNANPALRKTLKNLLHG